MPPTFDPLPLVLVEGWEFLLPAVLDGEPEPRQLRSPAQLKKRSAGSSSGSAGTATVDRSAGVAPICAAHIRSWFIAPAPTSSPAISRARRYEAISTSARSDSISQRTSRRN